MSDFQQRDGTGALFRNSRKEKETHPDYTGKIKVAGKEWRLAAWVKLDKSGDKYLSISAQDPGQRGDRPRQENTRQQPEQVHGQAPARQDDDFGDSIPF